MKKKIREIAESVTNENWFYSSRRFPGTSEVVFMKKINATARITEIGSFSDVIVRLFKNEIDASSDVSNDTFLIDVFAELEMLSVNLTTTIKTDKILSNLDVADADRDDMIRRLNVALSGYEVLPFPAYQQAASNLLPIMAKYKGIMGESYLSESILIKSMLNDLRSLEAIDAISALPGIAELVQMLTEAQNRFDQTYDDYNAACINKSGSASSLKKPMLSLINDRIIPYLNVMSVSKPTYAEFIAKFESNVNRTNMMVLKRRKTGTSDMSLEVDNVELATPEV